MRTQGGTRTGWNSTGHELSRISLTPAWAVHSLSTRVTAKMESTNGNDRLSHQITGVIRASALEDSFLQPAIKERNETPNWRSLSICTVLSGTGRPRLRVISFGADILPSDEGSRRNVLFGENYL